MDSLLGTQNTVDADEANPEHVSARQPNVTARLLGHHVNALSLEQDSDQPSIQTVAEINGISKEQIPGLIESKGYVCRARDFREQVSDIRRTTEYEYLGEGLGSPNESSNEHEGLGQLADFLKAHAPNNPMARGMLDSLTFIGEAELHEATAGIAAYWKHFLDNNVNSQLCVVAGLSISAERCSCCMPTHKGMVRSDRYMIERILEHFTEEELDGYRGRLLLGLNHVKMNDKPTKVVLIDDWIISGQQMGHVVSQLKGRRYNDVEINLIAAPAELIENGFVSNGQRTTVRSYFMAHTATGAVDPSSGTAYITGTHCSVDRNFARSLQAMEQPGPSLTRVLGKYDTGGLPRTRRMKPE
jgi:hypothetical protein